MKKYGRWIWFGIVAVVLLVVLIVVGANQSLRRKVEALLLERFVRNKVKDLEDKATVIKTKATMNEGDAKEAEAKAAELDKQIAEEKRKLQQGLAERGLSADEISNRFNNLNI